MILESWNSFFIFILILIQGVLEDIKVGLDVHLLPLPTGRNLVDSDINFGILCIFLLLKSVYAVLSILALLISCG